MSMCMLKWQVNMACWHVKLIWHGVVSRGMRTRGLSHVFHIVMPHINNKKERNNNNNKVNKYMNRITINKGKIYE